MDWCVYFPIIFYAEVSSVPSEEEAHKAHREPPVSSETVIMRWVSQRPLECAPIPVQDRHLHCFWVTRHDDKEWKTLTKCPRPVFQSILSWRRPYCNRVGYFCPFRTVFPLSQTLPFVSSKACGAWACWKKTCPCCDKAVSQVWISHLWCCALCSLCVLKSFFPGREKKPADTTENFKRRHSKLINSCKYLLPGVLWQSPLCQHLSPLQWAQRRGTPATWWLGGCSVRE